MQRASKDGIDERAATGNCSDEADILLRYPALCDELVACEAQDVLTGWQVAQDPRLAAETGQPDAAMPVHVAHRLREVPAQLLGAAHDRNRHNAAPVEQFLHHGETGTVEETDELVEGRPERDAGVEHEPPRLVEVAPGDVRRVEPATELTCGNRGHDVAREPRWDRR